MPGLRVHWECQSVELRSESSLTPWLYRSEPCRDSNAKLFEIGRRFPLHARCRPREPEADRLQRGDRRLDRLLDQSTEPDAQVWTVPCFEAVDDGASRVASVECVRGAKRIAGPFGS